MKRLIKSRLWVIPLFILLYFAIKYLVPSEKEQEVEKMAHFEERNAIEKQLVGKWNFDDFSEGKEDKRNYHLLSANGDYTYRGNDNSKTTGYAWSASEEDSILQLKTGKPLKTVSYKILSIKKDTIILHRLKKEAFQPQISTWSRNKTWKKK